MLKLLALIIGLQVLSNPINQDLERNLGVANNSHYVEFLNGEGYYIEEDGVVNRGDVVYVTDDGEIQIILEMESE